jgi:hypothetical protein
MSEEANATVTAAHVATVQIGTVSQEGIESELILTNNWTSAVVLVPIFTKRENFGECHHEIAKFSVKMLMFVCISSSYSLDCQSIEGKGEDFLYLLTEYRATESRSRFRR